MPRIVTPRFFIYTPMYYIKMWLVYVIINFTVVLCRNKQPENKTEERPEVYCDRSVRYADDAYEDYLDSFFDSKLVVIAYNSDKYKFHPIVPGIFIDYHLILTSYSPFRGNRTAGYGLSWYKVCLLTERIRDWQTGSYVFRSSEHIPICARQIIPIPDSYNKRKHYIGARRTFAPMHDLMVLRLVPYDYAVRSSYNWFYGAALGFKFPVPVHIAKPTYDLSTGYVTIASLAFGDIYHIRESKTLLSKEFYLEGMIEDCDEWLPRWWGHFICLKNKGKFLGLGSGSFLVHNGALYGIGSFMLNKRNRSILVFTDVRKYYRMYGSVCHEYESTAIRCWQGYDRDTFWYYAHHKETRLHEYMFTKCKFS